MVMIEYKTCERIGPFWTGLRRRGYTLTEATIAGSPLIRCTSPSGATWVTTTQISHPMNSGTIEEIAKQKDIAYDLVKLAGGSIPVTKVIDRSEPIGQVAEILNHVSKVVVKPIDSSGSNGVTCDITEESQLIRALTEARQYSSDVIVQEQVYGDEVRFTVLNGEVVSVLLRRGPRVVGNGVSTISALIEEENKSRRLLTLPYIHYPQLTPALIDESYFTNTSIPAEGEIVQFSNATMVKKGASIYEVLSTVHPSYVEFAKRLASDMGGGFLAVDIFMVDYATEMKKGNHWFNEFNASPAIALYYASRGESSAHVVEELLDTVDAVINYRKEKKYDA